MPPPDPPNRHICVCGYEVPHWANMLAHRRQCESWQEHVQAIRDSVHHPQQYGLPRVNPEPTPTEQPGGRPECPYCERTFGNTPLMLAHVDVCGERKTRDVANASRALKESERIAADLDNLAAFEAWCREHGRG